MRRSGPMALVIALLASSLVFASGGSSSADDRLFPVSLLHFGAGRSAVAPVDGAGGLDRFVELVRREHTRAAQVGADIVIGTGDHFQAGPEFAAAREEPDAALDALALSRIPADAYVVGDLDLDFGPHTLAQFIEGVARGANLPTFVSATVDAGRDPTLGPLVESGRLASSTVVTRWGRPIGIVGVTAAGTRPTGAVEVDGDTVAAAQREIDRLTDAGVDIVIVGSHLASLTADLDLVSRLDGVDLVVSGGGDDLLADAGAALAPGDEARVAGRYPLLQQDRQGRFVPVTAVGGQYRYLGRLVAWFDGNGDIVRLEPSSGPIVVDETVPPQRFVGRRVVDETEARVAAQPVTALAVSQVELDGVRATTRTRESNLGNLVADAVLARATRAAQAIEQPVPDVALVSSASIGFDHVIDAGPVSVRDTFDATSNELVVLAEPMSRSRLKRVLEYSVAGAEDVSPRWVQVAGLSMVVELDRPALELGADGRVTQAGRRIRSVTLDTGEVVVAGGDVVVGDPVRVAFDRSLVRLGHPVGSVEDAMWVGATVQQALAGFLSDELGGAVGARQYPEGGEGRIERPGAPPQP